MPTKAKIYKVTKDFPIPGADYHAGDEFALPPGWKEEEGKFLEPYEVMESNEKGERVKTTYYRTHLLPVKNA